MSYTIAICNSDGSNWQTCLTSDGRKTTTYFGVCPACRRTDGYINVGKGHWGFCKEHKVKWVFGVNLFSSWRDETEDQQRAIYDGLGFGDYKKVEPWDDPRWRAPEPDRAEHNYIESFEDLGGLTAGTPA